MSSSERSSSGESDDESLPDLQKLKPYDLEPEILSLDGISTSSDEEELSSSDCEAESRIGKTYTIMCTNNEKNDQFYRKVAFLMYSERVNFRPQSWKEASKLKPHRGLGTRLPSP